MTVSTKTSRISSIDILRGLVMIIMLVDHVRERFFSNIPITDPMNINVIEPKFFFTRISTHFCAPTFVFLTGLGAWLYANPKNKPPRSASLFLFKRGIFLLLLELTVVNFSWYGAYQTLYLQIIWAIGMSMIALSLFSKLPRLLILIIGILIVAGHNILTPISFNYDEIGFSLWTILHDRGYLLKDSVVNVKVSYPILPWIGLILLGYFSGALYKHERTFKNRAKWLVSLSAICLSLLLILRGFNIYGETLPWETQDSALKTVMSFINFTKYPPSFNYLLLTIGVGFILLWFFEYFNYKWMQLLKVMGAAPMFFYIIHLYALLLVFKLLVFTNFLTEENDFSFPEYYQLLIVSIIFIIVLYFPTKRFSEYKRKSNSKLIKYF
ncbi:hypothetical protein A8C32_05835 [Flavivirga aquatica]|uniref:Heparan-alpha-glucosaminide N-acetyltransferase catalytic domain-containing protein n=1 Tax=Flavivirga aquatica TaxID=1849968 RepID=A0A1E5SHV4_9FLAO|nr:heparan-alpha-glucosaminide N-acetyltransferase domain-containing protein [Flavivirga aquatica]OEJ98717.1 hypothetical protein A8C32_05835 [Flavivirga aquatica]